MDTQITLQSSPRIHGNVKEESTASVDDQPIIELVSQSNAIKEEDRKQKTVDCRLETRIKIESPPIDDGCSDPTRETPLFDLPIEPSTSCEHSFLPQNDSQRQILARLDMTTLNITALEGIIKSSFQKNVVSCVEPNRECVHTLNREREETEETITQESPAQTSGQQVPTLVLLGRLEELTSTLASCAEKMTTLLSTFLTIEREGSSNNKALNEEMGHEQNEQNEMSEVVQDPEPRGSALIREHEERERNIYLYNRETTKNGVENSLKQSGRNQEKTDSKKSLSLQLEVDPTRPFEGKLDERIRNETEIGLQQNEPEIEPDQARPFPTSSSPVTTNRMQQSHCLNQYQIQQNVVFPFEPIDEKFFAGKFHERPSQLMGFVERSPSLHFQLKDVVFLEREALIFRYFFNGLFSELRASRISFLISFLILLLSLWFLATIVLIIALFHTRENLLDDFSTSQFILTIAYQIFQTVFLFVLLWIARRLVTVFTNCFAWAESSQGYVFIENRRFKFKIKEFRLFVQQVFWLRLTIAFLSLYVSTNLYVIIRLIVELQALLNKNDQIDGSQFVFWSISTFITMSITNILVVFFAFRAAATSR